MHACPLLHPHLPTIIRLVAILDKQVDVSENDSKMKLMVP
jgi:hypothetical protein